MASTFQIISLFFLMHTITCKSHAPSNIFCIPSIQCTINCLNQSQCSNKTIHCPFNEHCNIHCHSPHSCSNTTIIANHSSHLTLHSLSPHSITHSHIYCPSHCQIYGNSNTQWTDIHIHINNTNCTLSNYNYHCLTHDTHTRQLLSNTTNTTLSASHTHSYPFGIQLTATEISWLLFTAAILVMSLLCALLCLVYCLCKQRRTKSADKDNIDRNISNDMRLRYLVLAYSDGKKLKIPFDINTLDQFGEPNRKSSEYLSEYLSDDEHNKIVSAVLLDNDMEHSNIENTENTVIYDSNIEVIMEQTHTHTEEDQTLTQTQNSKKLMVFGENAQKRIVQNEYSSTMNDLSQMKKYKTRNDSELNMDSKDSESITSSLEIVELDASKKNESRHKQTSSEPQIFPPILRQNSNDKERPKTARKEHIYHSSNDSDTIIERTKFNNLYINEDIPSMQISDSAPQNNRRIVTVSPSKKGRRNPKALPKPIPNKKHNNSNYLQINHAPNDMHYSHSTSAMNKRYQTAMQHTMSRHHQRHQRTLQPTANDYNAQIKVQKRRKKRYHRHMSEPSNIMSDIKPESSPEDMAMVPITFVDGEMSSYSHSRARSKSHPTKGQGFDNGESTDRPKASKKRKKKHKKRKRKSSTPTARKKNKSYPRHRQPGGSDKLRKKRTKDANPFDIVTSHKLHIPKKKDRKRGYYDTDNHYYHSNYAKHKQKLEAKISGNSNLTTTTLSETPIPKDVSYIIDHNKVVTPINIDLLNNDISQITQSPGKTTTISSAMVPPPPSPQLTNKKYSNMSPSPSPSFHLDVESGTARHITEQRNSQNTHSTVTYDGGPLKGIQYDHDSESSLSQDTANSGTNKVNTRTPRTEQSDTATVTFRNLKYSVGSIEQEEGGMTLTVPVMDNFKIRVQDLTQAEIDISESNSEINVSESSVSSSEKVSGKGVPPPVHSGSNLSKRHYIVGSLDSDKMFIPPVPVPSNNPYSHRKLKPLPDTQSIGTISPDWRSRHSGKGGYYDSGHTSQSTGFRYANSMEETETVYSSNDEEKSFKPTVSTHTTQAQTFPSITDTNSKGFEKEYYFAHQLEETIKSLTKSENGQSRISDEAQEQLIAQQSFIQIDDDRIWQRQREVNKDVNSKHYVE